MDVETTKVWRLIAVNTKDRYRKALKRRAVKMVDDLIESDETSDYSEAAVEVKIHAMRDAFQSAGRVNDRIGPFYTSGRVERLLGVSRQAVSERARRDRLLRVTTSDGVKVFPAFQFTATGVRSNLVPVIETLLNSGADPWTVAYWLTAPMNSFDGRTAVEVVGDGADARRRLLMQAADDAASWRTESA